MNSLCICLLSVKGIQPNSLCKASREDLYFAPVTVRAASS